MKLTKNWEELMSETNVIDEKQLQANYPEVYLQLKSCLSSKGSIKRIFHTITKPNKTSIFTIFDKYEYFSILTTEEYLWFEQDRINHKFHKLSCPISDIWASHIKAVEDDGLKYELLNWNRKPMIYSYFCNEAWGRVFIQQLNKIKIDLNLPTVK